jgi:MoaA/NifB/PqqE/SkfB family radical SAM enzyme
MLNKPTLPFVEMMITQACNLSCTGCTNYSDLVHHGYLTWEQGKQQIVPWLERVEIPDFGILGGEPLMNPYVGDWIIGLRQLLPDSQIRFTTNGVLLSKNLDLIDLMHEIGNVVFKITFHENNPELEEVVNHIMKKYTWEPVIEFGIDRLKTSNNLRFQVKRPHTFYKTFVGEYHEMMPHNSDPNDAFESCSQQICPLLYEGKMYKCSTNGLLKSTLARFGNVNFDSWQPYITTGLDPYCDPKELDKFLMNFGKPEKICSGCPTISDINSKIEHMKNVSRRKIIPLKK